MVNLSYYGALKILGRKWFWIEDNPVKAMLFLAYERYVLRQQYSAYHAVSLATQRDLISHGVDESITVPILPRSCCQDEARNRTR